MTDVFLVVLRIAIMSVPVICVIFIVKAVTGKRMPNSFHYALWLILIFRLVMPIGLPDSPGIANVLPELQAGAPVYQQAPDNTGEHIPERVETPPVKPVNQVQPATAEHSAVPAAPGVTFLQACTIAWLFGALLTLAYFIAASLRIRRKIRSTTVPWQAPADILPEDILSGKRCSIVCCTGFGSPFVFGILRPVVVLPCSAVLKMDQSDLRLILQHELAHIRRHDVLILHISSLLRCVYWFNPFIHIALSGMKADQEIACDASVVKGFGSSERKSYACVLLTVASGAAKRAAAGISEFGKGNTKRRVEEIVNKKKYAPLTVFIAAIIILAVGCFVLTTINANAKAEAPGTVSIVDTPTASITPPATGSVVPEASAPAAASISAAVEDFNAVANKNFTGEPYALLKVSLDDGGYAEKRFPGTWISQITTGDVDGNGTEEIVLYLEFLGSSGYGIGEAHVLRVAGNELIEYPSNFIQNPAVALECPESFTPRMFGTLCGASAVTRNGHDVLRVTHWLNGSDDSLQYTYASYNGSGWQIESAEMLSGEQHIAQKKSDAISGETPSVHRDGFKNAELTFIFDSDNPVSDGRDPDKQYYYGEQNEILMPTLRDSAQAALQQLYDMTGFIVKECYVLSTGDTLLFSMDKNDFNFGSFFLYSINPMLSLPDGGGVPWNMSISLPIDADGIAVPENISEMSDGEVAKWYYEHSTFGDRRKVISTEPDHIGFIRLYLENGDFYEATLNSSRVIENLCGPYPKGYEH